MTAFPKRQFTRIRIGLGLVCFLFFAGALPYARELLAFDGAVPVWTKTVLHSPVPNILTFQDGALKAQLFLTAGAAVSLAFAAGIYRRISALLLWYLLVCFFARDPLVRNVSASYIGWMLLASAVLPVKKEWDPKLAKILWIGAWVILSVSYAISGFHKLGSSEWRNGTAIGILIHTPIARAWVAEFPSALTVFLSWAILAGEILFLPLACFRKSRPIAWAWLTIVHCGIAAFTHLTQLSLGVLLFHFWVFDARWATKIWRMAFPQSSTQSLSEDDSRSTSRIFG